MELAKLDKILDEIKVFPSSVVKRGEALLYLSHTDYVWIINLTEEKQANQNETDQWGNDEESW